MPMLAKIAVVAVVAIVLLVVKLSRRKPSGGGSLFKD